MAKKIIVLSGSPKRHGNTELLVDWFAQGAREKGAEVEVVHTAFLESKSNGCRSCRACQVLREYGCLIDDAITPVLARVIEADVIVMATPMYFFAMSAQLKMIYDRMFCLYKWDNEKGTMQTPLKGKTLVVIASAFEDVGLDALSAPFQLTAEYTGMKFDQLLISNAGVSGDILKNPVAQKQAVALGQRVAAIR